MGDSDKTHIIDYDDQRPTTNNNQSIIYITTANGGSVPTWQIQMTYRTMMRTLEINGVISLRLVT